MIAGVFVFGTLCQLASGASPDIDQTRKLKLAAFEEAWNASLVAGHAVRKARYAVDFFEMQLKKSQESGMGVSGPEEDLSKAREALEIADRVNITAEDNLTVAKANLRSSNAMSP